MRQNFACDSLEPHFDLGGSWGFWCFSHGDEVNRKKVGVGWVSAWGCRNFIFIFIFIFISISKVVVMMMATCRLQVGEFLSFFHLTSPIFFFAFRSIKSWMSVFWFVFVFHSRNDVLASYLLSHRQPKACRRVSSFLSIPILFPVTTFMSMARFLVSVEDDWCSTLTRCGPRSDMQISGGCQDHFPCVQAWSALASLWRYTGRGVAWHGMASRARPRWNERPSRIVSGIHLFETVVIYLHSSTVL